MGLHKQWSQADIFLIIQIFGMVSDDDFLLYKYFFYFSRSSSMKKQKKLTLMNWNDPVKCEKERIRKQEMVMWFKFCVVDDRDNWRKTKELADMHQLYANNRWHESTRTK